MLADAEAAVSIPAADQNVLLIVSLPQVHSFMKQLGHIRKFSNVPHGLPISPEAQQPPRPRARRPIPNPDASPPMNRVARAPTVPGIAEDDENGLSSPSSLGDSPGADPEDDGGPPSPTPVRRKSKSRASTSRLPEPSPIDLPTVNFENQLKSGKRKPTRRQSGLLTTTMSITTVTERPPSPAFGSPLRREAGLREEEEVLAVIRGIDGQDDQEPEIITQSITRRERKTKTREVERGRESGSELVARERERKRPRDSDEPIGTADGGKKSKFKDVTNSPPDRLALDIPPGAFLIR